jgi:hypothetical protein
MLNLTRGRHIEIHDLYETSICAVQCPSVQALTKSLGEKLCCLCGCRQNTLSRFTVCAFTTSTSSMCAMNVFCGISNHPCTLLGFYFSKTYNHSCSTLNFTASALTERRSRSDTFSTLIFGDTCLRSCLHRWFAHCSSLTLVILRESPLSAR